MVNIISVVSWGRFVKKRILWGISLPLCCGGCWGRGAGGIGTLGGGCMPGGIIPCIIPCIMPCIIGIICSMLRLASPPEQDVHNILGGPLDQVKKAEKCRGRAFLVRKYTPWLTFVHPYSTSANWQQHLYLCTARIHRVVSIFGAFQSFQGLL